MIHTTTRNFHIHSRESFMLKSHLGIYISSSSIHSFVCSGILKLHRVCNLVCCEWNYTMHNNNLVSMKECNNFFPLTSESVASCGKKSFQASSHSNTPHIYRFVDKYYDDGKKAISNLGVFSSSWKVNLKNSHIW